jgi:hypothetical protein
LSDTDPAAELLLPTTSPVFTRSTTDVAVQFGDIVFVQLRRARNLVRTQYFRNASDPYVRLTMTRQVAALVGKAAKSSSPASSSAEKNLQSYTSRLVADTRDPVWEQSFAFWFDPGAAGLHSPVLRVQVMNRNSFGADSELGAIELRLDAIARDDRNVEQWHALRNVGSGEVLLSVGRSALASGFLRDVLLVRVGAGRAGGSVWDVVAK